MVSLLNVSAVSAQARTPFGNCTYWLDQSQPAGGKIFKIAFAHGFVLGVLGSLPQEPHSDPNWARLEQQLEKGLGAALQRPALLADAFDQKCGDYRNRALTLNNIGLLVFLEVGGVSAGGVEKALEVLRAGGDTEAAMNALIRSQ